MVSAGRPSIIRDPFVIYIFSVSILIASHSPFLIKFFVSLLFCTTKQQATKCVRRAIYPPLQFPLCLDCVKGCVVKRAEGDKFGKETSFQDLKLNADDIEVKLRV
jgi:hypothetical protein